ncbi:dCTP pyrophosphatase 1-like [Haliotis cracherodii]|uniref:dCTP pyrophosphatase 1-like n=1 Tax=Haliotis cracherodii TaxID=6455 RepID=UPI0039ECF0BB
MAEKRPRMEADGKEDVDGNTNQSHGTFMFSNKPSLEEIRKISSKFADDRDWNQFHTPRNLLLALTAEVGELTEIFQWKGEVKEGLPDFSEAEKRHVGQEMSDVLLYLVRLADKCHVDLTAAVVDKIKLNGKKYPADKVYGKSNKYTDYDNSNHGDS